MNGKMSKSGMSLLMMAIVALSAILLTIPAMAVGDITATRGFSNQTVAPGGNFTVTVTVTANQTVYAPLLDEDLPDGWTVTEIDSAGATFKESEIKWLWMGSLSAGASKTGIYNVTVPADAAGGDYWITGNISAYEVDPTAVGGESKITVSAGPAPTSPQTTPTLTSPTSTPLPMPSPAPTAAATPAATPTAAPTAAPHITPAPTAKPTAKPTPTPTEEPGFEAVFAIAGLLAVAYLVVRRKKR